MARNPSPEENALNPTRTIQYEFQDFLKKTEGPLASYEFTANGIFRETEFGKLMSGPGCQRKHFYLSLLELRSTNTQKSIERFNTCAREGVNGIINPVNPVDAAIKCYSILISHLMSQGKGEIAWGVCIFLMQDYSTTTAEDKRGILDLILSDAEAYAAAPQGIKDEIQHELQSGRLTSAHHAQGVQNVGILFPTRLDFSGAAAAGPAGMGGKRKSKSKSKSKSKIAKKSIKKNMKKSRRLKKKSKISRKK